MSLFDVSDVVAGLHAARDEWRDAQNRSHETGRREFPSREALAAIVESLKGALYPMRLGPPDLRRESEDFYVGYTLDTALQSLWTQARLELLYTARHDPRPAGEIDAQASAAVRDFAAALPGIRRLLDGDVLAAYQGDPAALSVDQVLLCYPGILAMIHHRLAHQLYRLGLPLLARIASELAHSVTGIDIHPGVQIGAGFFIDHGTGIVIGETAVIGDDVSMLQGVTLGGTGAERGDRHPKIGKGVLLGAGAKVLGNIRIGDYAKVASGSVVLKPVPAGCTAAGVPARLVNCPTCDEPARSMDQTLDETAYDYVI
jgi:serine O-acetyltransferase